MSKREKGFLGEEKVVNFLVEKNYQILFRNWRTKQGEIDIIALDKSNPKGDTLVFVEVKLELSDSKYCFACITEEERERTSDEFSYWYSLKRDNDD